MICVAIAVFTASATEEAKTVEKEKGIPSIDLGAAKLKIGGLAQVYGMSQGEESDFQLTNLRVSATLTSKSEKWGGWAVINTAKFQEDTDENWLMIAEAWYKIGDQTKLHVGRMFAAGGYTTPIAALNETVSYPTCDPTGSFIWGLQLEKLWGDEEDGILLLADIGGRSDAPSSLDEANWEGLEASCRLQKNFGKGNWFAGTAQVSEDYLRLALDTQYHLSPNLYLRGAMYWAKNDDRTSDLIGAYAMAVWEPINRFEIHGMIDVWDLQAKSWEETEVNVNKETSEVSVDQVECTSQTGHYIGLTAGVTGYLTADRNLKATVDIVVPVDDENNEPDPRIEGRISFRF